ncbi:hypothetical protein LCGC14_0864530 [marine sediment metagenome]|uniref:Uncharacterized protein n=1 Tax=marine sediment metagenome TaxID=412755 RepID=A0A0F9SDH2_9ZZZZ
MLIKSKVPMPVYLSKHNNLNQTKEYRKGYDKIFGKRDVLYHTKRSGRRVVKNYGGKKS